MGHATERGHMPAGFLFFVVLMPMPPAFYAGSDCEREVLAGSQNSGKEPKRLQHPEA